MKFSKDYVLFCHITTHIQAEKHGNLLEEKGGEGFPYIIFMDAEGKVLATHTSARTAEAFGKTGEKARSYIALKAKAEKGDKAAKMELLLTQVQLGHLKPDDAEKKMKEIGPLSKEQQAQIDGEKVNAMVLETVKTIEDEDGAKAVGKKFYEMQKAGKTGPTSDQAMQPYWILMMNHAEAQKDVATYEVALKTLKAKFGAMEEAKRFFEAKEKKLEELKAEKK